MKRIIILGGSIAAVKTIEQLHSYDDADEISLVLYDEYYPYDRDLIFDFISGAVTKKKMPVYPKEYYEQKRIKVVPSKIVTRINPKRKKIHLEDRSQIDFDVAVVTEVPDYKFPEIKGTNKTGLFTLARFKDVESVSENIMFADTIAIQSSRPDALKLALAVLKRGKEVLLITPNSSIFSFDCPSDLEQSLYESFKSQKLTILRENEIVEVLGDAETKAIRLRSGKVYSAQMIIFDAVIPDLRLLDETGVEIGPNIIVDENFRSNVEDFYATDGVCQLRDSSILKDDSFTWAETGKKIACAIKGREYAVSSRLESYNFQAPGFSLTTVGFVVQQSGIILQSQKEPADRSYLGLYIQDQQIQGAVLINCDHLKEQVISWVKDKINISNVTLPQLVKEKDQIQGVSVSQTLSTQT